MFGTMRTAAYSLYVLSLLIKIVISNSALNFLHFFFLVFLAAILQPPFYNPKYPK